VRAFILSGCDEVYVLADNTVCTESLDNLRKFLGTFFVTAQEAPLAVACEADKLLTCRVLRQRMWTSTSLTVVFSLLSALLSMQLIVNSAVLHEHARWRRLVRAVHDKEGSSSRPQGSSSG